MTTEEKIKKIAETFGMSNKALAKATGLSYNTVKLNNSPKSVKNNWNEKNLKDLMNYIKNESKKL